MDNIIVLLVWLLGLSLGFLFGFEVGLSRSKVDETEGEINNGLVPIPSGLITSDQICQNRI